MCANHENISAINISDWAFQGMKEEVLGYEVDTLKPHQCAADIFSHLMKDSHVWLACLNPHSYYISLSDKVFSRALRAADWLIADGVGIVVASRLLGGNINNRVTGSDVFYGLHNLMNNSGGMSVFFLGSTEDTLELIRQRMAKDYPHIILAGTYSPPFKSDFTEYEIDEMINVINAARPDVLWVGMTAPKQEKWIYNNLDRLEIKFAGAVGAVFDFYVGKVKRSHPFFQKAGMEWLPRLIQQPTRLWRRTFISAPIFLWHVLCATLRLRLFGAR